MIHLPASLLRAPLIKKNLKKVVLLFVSIMSLNVSRFSDNFSEMLDI